MASQIKLEGLAELLRTLKALPAEIGSKGGGPIRSALFQSTKIMRDEARARAPVDTGRLQRNVIAFRDRNPRASGVTEQYAITFRRGRKGRGGRKGYETTAGGDKDAYYGRFVEFGVPSKRIPANPFLRTAFEVTKQQSAESFVVSLRRAIALAVKKLERQNRVR